MRLRLCRDRSGTGRAGKAASCAAFECSPNVCAGVPEVRVRIALGLSFLELPQPSHEILGSVLAVLNSYPVDVLLSFFAGSHGKGGQVAHFRRLAANEDGV